MNPTEPNGDSPDVSLAELRVDQAADRRRRDRWLLETRRAATTPASVIRASVDLTLKVHLLDGAVVSGTVVAVGADYAEMDAGGSTVWISTSAVAAVEASSRTVGDPEELDVPDAMLVDVLEDLHMRGTRVTLTLVSGVTLSGPVSSVGASVTLLETGATTNVVVDPSSIAVVRLAGAGTRIF